MLQPTEINQPVSPPNDATNPTIPPITQDTRKLQQTINDKYRICNYCRVPHPGRKKCERRHIAESESPSRIHRPQGNLSQQNETNQPESPPDDATEPQIPLIHEYHKAKGGGIALTTKGNPLCGYCGIPKHPRSQCRRRAIDILKGIQRSEHHDKGNKLAIYSTDEKTYTLDNSRRKRSHNAQDDPNIPKTKLPHTHEEDNPIHITMNDNQKPTISASQVQVNLTDFPAEIIHHIMKYLPFKELMRLRKVNRRLWLLSDAESLWKDITISNSSLSCGLISEALNKQIIALNIRNCTIQGSYLNMLHLGRSLQNGLSTIKFLGLQGYKGSDIIASIIVAESTELETLDMSENRYSMVSTTIRKMKNNNKLTAINLSAVGGHYAEMGGMVYHPFDIHTMKPLVDKCRHLTDVILFGSKLTHEAITYFCENAPATLLRLNIARERAYNDDIRALTLSCPHLQYLNIAETSVAYQDIINIVLAWKKSLINLYLPHRLGFILTLRSRAPNLPLITQFQLLVLEMEKLKYLHVGHYKFHQADIDNTRPQVAKLKSLFPHLIINHNPYSMCPNTRRPNIPQSDPSFRFRRNIGPNSWTSRRDAEVVPIFDLN